MLMCTNICTYIQVNASISLFTFCSKILPEKPFQYLTCSKMWNVQAIDSIKTKYPEAIHPSISLDLVYVEELN